MTRFAQVILFPVSILYGLFMAVRNILFDLGILPSKSFPKPVISVGNLSFGGTGKTPQIEYLVRLLIPRMPVATLSRGYGRKSSGYIEASRRSNAKYIGDEPLQMLKKFEGLRVAVDEKRSRGVQRLFDRHPDLGVVLLDDAFQHRYVKPGLSILLTDYHKPYSEDHVLPSGTLREFPSGARRADIVVVTKTPKIFSPITRRRIIEELNLHSRQHIFFSYIHYGDPVPVFDQALTFPAKVINILLVTGIANDGPLREHLERQCSELVPMRYGDHHRYTVRDAEAIVKKFNDLPTQKKVLVTTEKDAMRLKTPALIPYLKNLPLFCVPIETEFHGSDKAQFDHEILSYVNQDKRDH